MTSRKRGRSSSYFRPAISTPVCHRWLLFFAPFPDRELFLGAGQGTRTALAACTDLGQVQGTAFLLHFVPARVAT